MLALHFIDIILIPVGKGQGLEGGCVCELGVGLNSEVRESTDDGGSAHANPPFSPNS